MSYPTRSLTVYARKTDGYLSKASGTSYAECQSDTPEPYGSGYGDRTGTSPHTIRVGQRYWETKSGAVLHWQQCRAYISFDTGNLGLAEEIVSSATLQVAPKTDTSDTDFNLIPVSHGDTPWEPGLGSGDWAKCDDTETEVSTSGMAADTYSSMAVAAAHINASGLTEFRLKSSREGTDPKLNGDDPYYEDVDFYSSRGTYPPKLVLALRIPKRLAIFLDCVTTLQGIDGTGNYNYDLSGTGDGLQVWKSPKAPHECPALPAACVVLDDATYTELSTSPLKFTTGSQTGADGWPIHIFGYFNYDLDTGHTGTLEKVGEKLESDIKIAMLTDPLRGNGDFVMGTFHTETRGPQNYGNGIGGIMMTFNVKYDFDPTAP